MTHSFQPLFKETSSEIRISDFGLEPILNSLLNSHKLSGIEPPLLAENPRVLWCADSENGGICSKARMVLSTEGFSLGFTSVDQSEVLLDNERSRQFYQTFLSKNVTVYGCAFGECF